MLRVIVKQKKKKGKIPSNTTKSTMAGTNTKLLIITLNITGLNDPIKRHILVDGIKKNSNHMLVAPMKCPSLQKTDVT